jgi:hypothetical protein
MISRGVADLIWTLTLGRRRRRREKEEEGA